MNGLSMIGATAAILYLLSTVPVLLALRKVTADSSIRVNRRLLLSLALAGFALNSVYTYESLFGSMSGELHLDLFNIASLFAWVLALLATSATLRQPVETLAAAGYGCSGAVLAASVFFNTPHTPETTLSAGVYLHIILSVIAYCVIAMAMAQACILSVQNHQLKHKHFNHLIRILPPLQTMEGLLFELITFGTLLLGSAIAVGFLYVEDFWAQHLIHKTALSLISLGVFVLLLSGRFFLGWRGKVAIRWTWAGFILLMLAYFGSKIALEVILKRG